MIGGIIGCVSCLMCAVPFLIIATYGKDSHEPVTFWSGDKSLKTKVKDLAGYNKEMALLYKKCAAAFLIAGLACLLQLWAGVVLICAECAIGPFLAHCSYKEILKKYS